MHLQNAPRPILARLFVYPITEFDELKTLSREKIAELSAQYGVSQATIKRRWKAHRENESKTNEK